MRSIRGGMEGQEGAGGPLPRGSVPGRREKIALGVAPGEGSGRNVGNSEGLHFSEVDGVGRGLVY
jgi:hypothetical protein